MKQGQSCCDEQKWRTFDKNVCYLNDIQFMHFRIRSSIKYKNKNMIQLYAIINDGEPMQCYVHQEKYRKQMETLLGLILKKITKSSSKVIKSQIISSYHVFYFSQASFIFILATQSASKSERMQNYLRVVADIFYDNYDQKKFKIILQRIMQQINRIQFGAKKSQGNHIEDEQSYLVNTQSFNDQKNRINQLLVRQNNQSRFAYCISVFLFVLIVILCVYYLEKNWN